MHSLQRGGLWPIVVAAPLHRLQYTNPLVIQKNFNPMPNPVAQLIEDNPQPAAS
jgi:hypothetical protein